MSRLSFCRALLRGFAKSIPMLKHKNKHCLIKTRIEKYFRNLWGFTYRIMLRNGKNGSYKIGKNININLINKIFDLIMPLGTQKIWTETGSWSIHHGYLGHSCRNLSRKSPTSTLFRHFCSKNLKYAELACHGISDSSSTYI